MKNPIKQFTSYLVFISALLLLLNQSCAKQETVLSVEAALIFNSGDVKPVARTEFLLLDKDFETILQESNFIADLPEEVKSPISHISSLKAFALVAFGAQKYGKYSDSQSSDINKLSLSLAKAMTVAKSHTVYSATTDFQGKAQFKDVKGGEYYLFGYTSAGESVAVWNLKTEVKSGQNSIILDQNNAEITN